MPSRFHIVPGTSHELPQYSHRRRGFPSHRAVSRESIKHPNLVVFYGIGKAAADNQYFMVLELMAKGSLRDLLKSDEELPWTERCRLCAEAAKGMLHVHSLGMMHRDFKSDNVLISEDVHAKVADFGQSTLSTAYKSFAAQRQRSYTNSASARNGMLADTVRPSDIGGGVSFADKSLTNGVGTPLWQAPELLANQTDYGILSMSILLGS